MKNKRFILAAALLMAMSSCDKNDWIWDYTEEERSLLDRVVGEYEITDASWDGGLLDLNNDGKTGTLFEEISEGGNSVGGGFSGLKDFGSIRVEKYDSDYSKFAGMLDVAVYDYFVEYGHAWWLYESFYSGFNVTGGQFSLDSDNSAAAGGQGISDISIVWTEDGRFVVSGDTCFRDYAADRVVYGRVTYTFSCVSGKGKTK